MDEPSIVRPPVELGRPVDACAPRPVLEGGFSEVGLGVEFTPIIDGQDAFLQVGYQRLWQLAVNTRVEDMDVGTGERAGIVLFRVFEDDQLISLDFGCRVLDFELIGDGQWQLASQYNVSLDPAFTSMLEGVTVTLQVEVRDREGRQAFSDRNVVARFAPKR